MIHRCHAIGCADPVRPELLMCRPHWRMLSNELRLAVWQTYRPGQCDDHKPSHKYCEAAKAAVIFVAAAEKRTVTGQERELLLYDFFLPRG